MIIAQVFIRLKVSSLIHLISLPEKLHSKIICFFIHLFYIKQIEIVYRMTFLNVYKEKVSVY